jgi:hypothetical protein
MGVINPKPKPKPEPSQNVVPDSQRISALGHDVCHSFRPFQKIGKDHNLVNFSIAGYPLYKHCPGKWAMQKTFGKGPVGTKPSASRLWETNFLSEQTEYSSDAKPF